MPNRRNTGRLLILGSSSGGQVFVGGENDAGGLLDMFAEPDFAQAEGVLNFFTVRDIAGDDDDVGRSSGAIEDDVPLRLDVADGPVAQEEAVFGPGAFAVLDGFAECLLVVFSIVGMDLVE
jgi:hypothetical protein